MPRSLFCGAGGHCSQSLIGNKGNRWSWANSSSWKVSYPTPVYAPYSDVQNVTMPLARPSPIRVRSAKLWPTVASTMKTGTFRASSCFFSLHILNNPQSSTPRSVGHLDYDTPVQSTFDPPKPHGITSKLCFWGKDLITVEASAQQQVSLLWRHRLRTGSAASKASAINTLRFRMVGKDKYNVHKHPRILN